MDKEKALIVITHDNGTSGTKTCLISVSDKIEILASKMTEHGVIYPEGIPHAAEQDPKEWWRAVCEGTKAVLAQSNIKPDQIEGISFSTQTQCALFVDKEGNPLDNPYIWIDGRAVKEFEVLRDGLIKVAGYDVFKMLQFVKVTGGGPGSAKDQMWKYQWFKKNKPELYKKVYKMLDVKDYLVFRCTGKMLCSKDTAHILWLYDTRPGKMEWHEGICKRYGINIDHLPEVKDSTDIAGELLPEPAKEMGLNPGTPVIMGGTDSSCIPVGSGAVQLNDTHIYVGTSGWIITIADKRITNLEDYEGGVLGAIPGTYNYIGIMETCGACLAWAKDHLADLEVAQAEEKGISPFVLLDDMASQSPPGANGLIFTPWLYGNRAPREDTRVRGSFFNLSIQNGRRDMFRSILEGVALHMRWMREGFDKKNVPITEPVRFVGGGANSSVWCQIIADVLGVKIQPVKYTQDGGAIGAGLIAAVGLGKTNFDEGKALVPVGKIYEPNLENKDIYDKIYKVFKKIYKKNKSLYHKLN